MLVNDGNKYVKLMLRAITFRRMVCDSLFVERLCSSSVTPMRSLLNPLTQWAAVSTYLSLISDAPQ